MITRSKIGSDGRETMIVCIRCSLDNRNICNGTKIVLVNDHVHESWLIYKSNEPMGYQELEKKKRETLELSEFEKWLNDHGYSEDERACKESREKTVH